MHHLPVVLAFALSLAVGYAGVSLAFPTPPHELRLVFQDRSCLDYGILHARMGSYHDTRSFLDSAECMVPE